MHPLIVLCLTSTAVPIPAERALEEALRRSYERDGLLVISFRDDSIHMRPYGDIDTWPSSDEPLTSCAGSALLLHEKRHLRLTRQHALPDPQRVWALHIPPPRWIGPPRQQRWLLPPVRRNQRR